MSMTNICPRCGREMESGYLGAESFISGAKWFTRKKILGTGGELIMRENKLGMVYIPGTRCYSCRILVLSY